jgi:hypothetical protein
VAIAVRQFAEDRDGALVIPVADDVLQEVGVESRGDFGKEVAAHRAAAVGEAGQCDGFRRAFGDVRLIEHDSVWRRERAQNSEEQSAVSAADVDYRTKARKVVDRSDAVRDDPREACHRSVEVCCLLGVFCHLLLYPFILGSGKRLLPQGVHAKFKLKTATPYPSGVVGLHYERAQGEA